MSYGLCFFVINIKVVLVHYEFLVFGLILLQRFIGIQMA